MCDSLSYWCTNMKPWAVVYLLASALVVSAQTPEAAPPAALKPLSPFTIKAAGQLAIGREVMTCLLYTSRVYKRQDVCPRIVAW